MWATHKIRQVFLDYFKGVGHQVVSSSPLVPQNDPTLLFTAAGMVQFKNVFTGLEKRPYQRAVTSQKCLRAGGKHNDLENVGYTARHHTFFEMLGNFSFGDYFKAEAIEWAWELVTKVYGLPADRLLITVFSEDEEAASLWRKIAGLSDDRIIRIATSDNFWSMGDTGPCGPCSEIFFDHGAHIPGGPPGSPDEDGDRFVEIWNLVFMQYDQVMGADGVVQRVPLPKPSIDTGSGLERVAAVLQGVHNNYEIDLFKGIIEGSQELTTSDPKMISSHRVIADHLRASSFLIADGVLPSNEGRGYVLRRIMRRAMRHAYLLGAKDPLMTRLVPLLTHQMGDAYPELLQAQPLIEETLRLEEERFRETLGRGLKLLEEETGRLTASQTLAGEVAFKLYDTFGFPLDLTQDILRGQGRQVDLEGFERCMAHQREEARKAWVGSGATAEEGFWLQLTQQVPATEFMGYDVTQCEGQIQTLVQNGQAVETVAPGQEFSFVATQTPFYAESGGQIGDTGTAETLGGTKLEITDCLKRVGKFHVHIARHVAGPALKVGDVLSLSINVARRNQLRGNHSATHLLHASLRKLLGPQVTQKGSLVTPDRLRFDFSYNQPLTPEQLVTLETEVNALIRRNTATETHLMSYDAAVKTGAMALFGEKYGDDVRVVMMGDGAQDEPAHHSVEFCGGTHVHRTGDIGYFKILSETGLAAGIRRIEALTGPGAEAYIQQTLAVVRSMGGMLKAPEDKLAERIQALLDERKDFEKQIQQLKQRLLKGEQSATEIQMIGAVQYIAKTLEDGSAKDLKATVDQLKSSLKNGVVVVGLVTEGKASLVVGVTETLTQQISAVDLVRIGSATLGGQGGGGRPDMAQAGGPLGDQLPAAYTAIADRLGQLAG